MDEMIRVTDNFDQAAGVLHQVSMRAENRVALMRNFTGIMEGEVNENFREEGRPTKWRPLADSTIRRRKAKGNWPGKILQVRGRLATSFKPYWDNNTAMYGTNVKYAKIQNFGGTTKHAARMRVLHFKKGSVDRFASEASASYGRKINGKIVYFSKGTGAGFAKANKRASYAMKVQGKAFSATIPARPFLYIGPGGIQKMIDAAKGWLMGIKGSGLLF